jgi:deferrochelatase/peroxidase EfeB
MKPDDILAADDDGQERGLHFICFNTDLGRQFEFVQHTWVNNPKFAGMYSELDPLVGDHGQRHRLEHDESTFTIPAEPVRHHVTGIERYVHVRGGAYFFLPGLKAIRVLANLPPAPADGSSLQREEE